MDDEGSMAVVSWGMHHGSLGHASGLDVHQINQERYERKLISLPTLSRANEQKGSL